MDKPSQPDFAELAVHALATDLLSWSEEDMRVHPQAEVLGAKISTAGDIHAQLVAIII